MLRRLPRGHREETTAEAFELLAKLDLRAWQMSKDKGKQSTNIPKESKCLKECGGRATQKALMIDIMVGEGLRNFWRVPEAA